MPSTRPRRPKPPDDIPELPTDLAKAAGELVALASRIRGCTACERACDARAYGTGYPRAPIMLVKEHPSAADLDASGSFVDEAEALAKAFEALRLPLSWTYGSTAVRCGDAPATTDQMKACAEHLLVEIEAVVPRVIVAFGPKTVEALQALDGCCGMRVPADVPQGEPVALRSDLALIVTEPLPEGITGKDAKRRLWRDLQLVGKLVGGRDVG